MRRYGLILIAAALTLPSLGFAQTGRGRAPRVAPPQGFFSPGIDRPDPRRGQQYTTRPGAGTITATTPNADGNFGGPGAGGGGGGA